MSKLIFGKTSSGASSGNQTEPTIAQKEAMVPSSLPNGPYSNTLTGKHVVETLFRSHFGFAFCIIIIYSQCSQSACLL